jgi:2-polyprenyl-6-methoxyphenol hydroxylase-like FAD-dependent oxidoreductase
MLGQDSASAILAKHLSKLNVAVEFGTELVSLEQDENVVTIVLKRSDGEEKLCVKYLVGADGAKGVTRKLSGVQFLGQSDKDIAALVMDAEIAGMDRKVIRAFNTCCRWRSLHTLVLA